MLSNVGWAVPHLPCREQEPQAGCWGREWFRGNSARTARKVGLGLPSYPGPWRRDAKSVLLFLNSRQSSCQKSAAAVECAGLAVQLIPGKASTQWESKERRRGEKREEGEGGKQGLNTQTSPPGRLGAAPMTTCMPALPGPRSHTAALPSSWSTFLLAKVGLGRHRPQQTSVGNSKVHFSWCANNYFVFNNAFSLRGDKSASIHIPPSRADQLTPTLSWHKQLWGRPKETCPTSQLVGEGTEKNNG